MIYLILGDQRVNPTTNKNSREGSGEGQVGRLPRNRQMVDAHLPKWRMTTRDQKIVKEVYKHRVLTAYQIYDLIFSPEKPGPPRNGISRCRHRLKLLFHSGYLARTEQPSIKSENRPYLYMLDRKAVPLLAEIFQVFPEKIEWKPKYNKLKPQSINHLVAGNDVRIAIEIAARRCRSVMKEWVDDLELRSRPDEVPKLRIIGQNEDLVWKRKIPDGFFRMKNGEYDFDHFLEIDMGTEPGRAIREKAEWFGAYFRSNWHRDVYNSNPKDLTILVVTTGSRRMENMKRIFENAGADDRVLFTTFGKATPYAVLEQPIWYAAGKHGSRSYFDD